MKCVYGTVYEAFCLSEKSDAKLYILPKIQVLVMEESVHFQNVCHLLLSNKNVVFKDKFPLTKAIKIKDFNSLHASYPEGKHARAKPLIMVTLRVTIVIMVILWVTIVIMVTLRVTILYKAQDCILCAARDKSRAYYSRSLLFPFGKQLETMHARSA